MDCYCWTDLMKLQMKLKRNNGYNIALSMKQPYIRIVLSFECEIILKPSNKNFIPYIISSEYPVNFWIYFPAIYPSKRDSIVVAIWRKYYFQMMHSIVELIKEIKEIKVLHVIQLLQVFGNKMDKTIILKTLKQFNQIYLDRLAKLKEIFSTNDISKSRSY
ncbi:hypothetical protein RFI_38889, partial [Reticulomyxa filosa]